MLMIVLDGQQIQQTVIVKGQELSEDRSGSIATTGDSEILLDANAARSGWILQASSDNGAPLLINEIGPAASGIGSFEIPPGSFFPPSNFPITTGVIQISGTTGDSWTAREW